MGDGKRTTFVADAMLGRLARWLRILGYDTVYLPALDDPGLARLARAEGRILLSRDNDLVCRTRPQSLMVVSEDIYEQVRQVIKDLNLAVDQAFSRCPVCNTQLQVISKEDVRGRVPPFVFLTQDQFRICDGCGRIYWRGTQWAAILERISDLGPEQEG